MEPFSIATGVLQVAGAGVQLAKGLHACATGFRDADKDLKAIATEVQLTSSALESLGYELEKQKDICSARLRQDVQGVLKCCQQCFDDIIDLLRACLGPDFGQSNSLSLSARAKWVFSKKGKMQALNASLSQQKITLTLMLEIVGVAARRTSP